MVANRNYLGSFVITMYSQISGKFTALQLAPWFLGTCLALIPQSSPAQMGQRLPALPQVQPMPVVEFNQYNQNFQPYQEVQLSQNFQRYLVYVDGGNSQILQQVRWIEPEAYIRQYQGRTIIQSGIFSQLVNAENRVRELQSYGINNVRIANFTDGREVGFSAAQPSQPVQSTLPNRREESGYYAVIPADARSLPVIADNIRRTSGYFELVQERQQPRGTHVAVGPFTERSIAQAWNQYLRELGYGNSRVYYGK